MLSAVNGRRKNHPIDRVSGAGFVRRPSCIPTQRPASNPKRPLVQLLFKRRLRTLSSELRTLCAVGGFKNKTLCNKGGRRRNVTDMKARRLHLANLLQLALLPNPRRRHKQRQRAARCCARRNRSTSTPRQERRCATCESDLACRAGRDNLADTVVGPRRRQA